MTQKTIKYFLDEIYSKPPKKNFVTNKTEVYHNGDVWSSDIMDLKDYKPENNRSCGYVLVNTDKFSKLGWYVLIENKTAKTIKASFENNLKTWKGKQNLVKTDKGKEFYNNIFQNFLNINNIKHFSRKS